MKKTITILLLVHAVITANAQEKIKVSAMNFMQMQMRINPEDLSWRTFKAPPSQYHGVPFFVADASARFYSKEEVEAFTNELDKILNPDKYFTSQEAYNQFNMAFIEKVRTDSKSSPPVKE